MTDYYILKRDYSTETTPSRTRSKEKKHSFYTLLPSTTQGEATMAITFARSSPAKIASSLTCGEDGRKSGEYLDNVTLEQGSVWGNAWWIVGHSVMRRHVRPSPGQRNSITGTGSISRILNTKHDLYWGLDTVLFDMLAHEFPGKAASPSSS